MFVLCWFTSKFTYSRFLQLLNNLNILNFQRWISRLLYRWRTQRNAIRNANCRTASHQIFERKWRRIRPSCLFQCIRLITSKSLMWLSFSLTKHAVASAKRLIEAVTNWWSSLRAPTGKQRLSKNLSTNGTWNRQDYPLNLSISVSGGKENNNDYLSSGEWIGKSPRC